MRGRIRGLWRTVQTSGTCRTGSVGLAALRPTRAPGRAREFWEQLIRSGTGGTGQSSIKAFQCRGNAKNIVRCSSMW